MRVITGSCYDENGYILGEEYTKQTGFILSGSYSAIGWVKDTKIVGIAIFDNYTGVNIDLHIWGPGAITKSAIKQVYDYAFKQLKCIRLTGRIYKTNKNLLQLMHRTGFVYECTLQNYAGSPDEPIDVEIYKISRNQAFKWISRHGRLAKSTSCSRSGSTAENSLGRG